MAEKKRKSEKKSSRAMKRAARNLQRYEKEKPATKEEVAELLGITLKRYEAIRKDGTGLDLDKLERLHDMGNVQLDRFVTNDRGFGLIKRQRAMALLMTAGWLLRLLRMRSTEPVLRRSENSSMRVFFRNQQTD